MSAPNTMPITGGRLLELALVAIVSAAISGGLTSWATRLAVEQQLVHLTASQEELKQELRELRRVIYRPAWPEHEPLMLNVSIYDLVKDLRDSLHSAAEFFHGSDSDDDPDADFRRHLQVAAADLGERRGLTLIGEVELVAGQAKYNSLPEDLVYIKTPLWGSEERIMPYEDNYPGPMPRARLAREGEVQVLYLTPAPTHQQIATLGNTYRFFYGASYWDGDPEATLSLERDDRALLLLRAQAEACRELAMQNMTRPIETRTSLSMPRNQTPRALWEAFMAEYNKRLGVSA